MFCNISIWALIVSSIAAMIVSTVWYSDFVLGNQWRAYMGNLFTVKPTPKEMAKSFGIQFVLTLITNFVLARVLFYADAITWARGLTVAVLVWIGFVAAIHAGAILWEKKPWKLIAINAGAYLVAFIVSGIIIAIWR